ncbi:MULTISPECIES: hypothetical protein [Pseudomonas]|uniref:hypothetical protein n=1 Tax=Pseudomonas TaxID=286 RepID=UPI00215BAB63|nr:MULTISPECIES: hypothetical protein [unclassified Pseudomonas]MCR8931768.1 hypothetical protein [Pseudomonas sp. S11A4]MCR8975375.1 hypothetical protein [Pseudomonas sp. S11P7]
MSKEESVISKAKFAEAELLTLIDRMLRDLPDGNGGRAKIRQVTQRQERNLGGYDAVATSVQPFYIQAKTSSFHSGKSTSKIISSRNAIPVNSNPGAFAFDLRKHRGTDEPLQHNALYWLSLRSTAAYVCPTFLSEHELENRLEKALDLKRHEIWHYRDDVYTEAGNSQSQSFQALHFHGLLTIIPHRLVATYRHRYSYDNSATPSIVFHSDPENVGEARSFTSFVETLSSQSQIPDKVFSRITRPVSFERLKDTQLSWIEEAFDPATQGLNIKASDVSESLSSAFLSRTTNFQNTSHALKYLQKLDGRDVSVFFGALLKKKYSIYQHYLLRLD